MMEKQYKNILVNSLVNLGDVVLTTSAIALLKQVYPQARITMLVRPVVREAVENNPVIDEVLIFDYKCAIIILQTTMDRRIQKCSRIRQTAERIS